MNRVTVINGLECCISKPERNCSKCPYNNETKDWPCESWRMKRDALLFLKKDEQLIRKLTKYINKLQLSYKEK